MDLQTNYFYERPPKREGYYIYEAQPEDQPLYYYYEPVTPPPSPPRTRVRAKKNYALAVRNRAPAETDIDSLPDRGPMPGEPSRERSRAFNNTSMTITYKTHIPKDEYKKWFIEVIVPRYSDEGNEVLFLEMAHETGDKENPYLHTHVVYKTMYPITTRDQFALDWDDIHPNWAYINSQKHWSNATRYLAKEDPDNALLKRGDTQEWKVTVERSKNVAEALRNTRCRPGDVQGIITYHGIVTKPEIAPRLSPANFHRWQVELYEIMNENSKVRPPLPRIVDPANRNKREVIPIPGLAAAYDPASRTIGLIVDAKGGAGKTQFIKALHYHEPDRFLVVQGIPQLKDFGTQVQEAQSSGWNGDAILFNLTRTQVDYKVHATLEASIDGFITAVKFKGGTVLFEPRNIWVFANDIPDLMKVTTDRWRIFTVWADFKKELMSWLEPLPFADAMVMREANHQARAEEKATEREMSIYSRRREDR